MSQERIVSHVKSQLFQRRAGELFIERGTLLHNGLGDLGQTKEDEAHKVLGQASAFERGWQEAVNIWTEAQIVLEDLYTVLGPALSAEIATGTPAIQREKQVDTALVVPQQEKKKQPRRSADEKPITSKLYPSERKLVDKLCGGDIDGSELARFLFPDQKDLRIAKQRLGVVLSQVRSKGFDVVNLTSHQERATGKEARYSLKEAAKLGMEPQVVAEEVVEVQPSTKQLTDVEVCILAKALTNGELLRREGVKVHWADQERIRLELTKTASDNIVSGDNDAKDLFTKLVKFVSQDDVAKDELLNANKDNDWAGQLLVILLNSGVNSEEGLRRLLLPS